MNKKTIRDVDVHSKRVLVRVDFNVPLDEVGAITDDTRIRSVVPTIEYLINNGARVILMSHLGRPKGVPTPKFSLKPAAQRLSEILNMPVPLLPDCVGAVVEQDVTLMEPGGVVMLENLRFHAEEEANDPVFAAQLARLGDVYVNDAFGSAHRAHASTEGVAHHLPAVAGFLMQVELDVMGKALSDPARPFVAILGGAKVSDKIGVISNLLDTVGVDTLLIGGGMANTFLKAKGVAIGRSLVEEDKVETAKHLLAGAKGAALLLPVDAVIGDAFSNDANTRIITLDGDGAESVPDGWAIYDIGPRTVERYTGTLTGTKTVMWNGPMGVFELDSFAAGTRAIASALADATDDGAITIIGGGDSVAAVEQAGFANRISHISTGGGASLEFLEGRKLPGVAALQDS